MRPASVSTASSRRLRSPSFSTSGSDFSMSENAPASSAAERRPASATAVEIFSSLIRLKIFTGGLVGDLTGLEQHRVIEALEGPDLLRNLHRRRHGTARDGYRRERRRVGGSGTQTSQHFL